MYSRQEKIALLKSAFGKVTIHADHVNVLCHCPNSKCFTANTSKLKLVVHLDKNYYHCWVCGIKGRNIADLARKYRKGSDQFFKAFKTSIVEDVIPIQQNALPHDFCLLTETPEATRIIQYLTYRGISETDMWRYRLGMSISDKERIYIPSFDDMGKLNFFVSRAISNSIFPRYKNAQRHKQEIIFNDLDIVWGNELLLTEGPFDLMKCSLVNSTCVLGNNLIKGSALFDKIVLTNTPVVLAFDTKEIEQTQRAAQLLHSYDIPVRIFDSSGFNDLGEMSKMQVKERYITAMPWSPHSSLKSRISNL